MNQNENMNECNWVLGLYNKYQTTVLICKHLEKSTTKSNNVLFGPGQLLVLACLIVVLLWSSKESIFINPLLLDYAIFKTIFAQTEHT